MTVPYSSDLYVRAEKGRSQQARGAEISSLYIRDGKARQRAKARLLRGRYYTALYCATGWVGAWVKINEAAGEGLRLSRDGALADACLPADGGNIALFSYR